MCASPAFIRSDVALPRRLGGTRDGRSPKDALFYSRENPRSSPNFYFCYFGERRFNDAQQNSTCSLSRPAIEALGSLKLRLPGSDLH